jgi:serine/threonine protein kinase
LTQSDVLGEGRYRLVSQIALPETQQKQGAAWAAIDTKLSQHRVEIREMRVPRDLVRGSSSDQICYMVAQRLRALGEHAGLPRVHDFFTERGIHYIVFDYPEGVSLASLLKRYGGALPEYQVATYGYQICGLLALLADQQPPLVHGSINPDTIYIDEEQRTASLIHLPLFRPDPPPSSSGQVSAGYYAPEQVHGDINPATDLYGLAVTMHHMVTGYDPRTRLALFHPPARRLNPTVTTQMELILARQLSLSASQRYAHPSEMQRDLLALLEAYPDSSTSEPLGQSANPLQMSAVELHEKSRNMLLLNMGVFAAICVLLLIGIIVVVLR